MEKIMKTFMAIVFALGTIAVVGRRERQRPQHAQREAILQEAGYGAAVTKRLYLLGAGRRARAGALSLT